MPLPIAPPSEGKLGSRNGEATTGPSVAIELSQRGGNVVDDYEVALQSRTNPPIAPTLYGGGPAVLGSREMHGQRAVEIDYPRSQWRIGGSPSAGRNRQDVVPASLAGCLGRQLPRSPPLDSCCSALSHPLDGWQELVRYPARPVVALTLAAGALSALVLWLVD